MTRISYLILIALASLFPLETFAQKYAMHVRDSIEIRSNAWQDTITCQMLKPTSFDRDAGTQTFPLIILLDQQNGFTFEYNLSTIDILCMHQQVPQSVVIGVPFPIEKRWYLTSFDKKENESISGLDKTEKLLFEEIIPTMRSQYNTNGPVILIGHSRTAYLANIMMVRHPKELAAVGAFSGFFSKEFSASDMVKAVSESPARVPMIGANMNLWTGKYCHHYYSAGTSIEEDNYLTDYSIYYVISDTLLKSRNNFSHFMVGVQHTHMTSYVISLQSMLIDYFGEYSKILSHWLYEKCNILSGDKVAETLRKDFEELNFRYGSNIIPNPVHIFSIASHYYNEEELEVCNQILDFGREYYPMDPEMAPW